MKRTCTELCAYCGAECDQTLEVGGYPACSDGCRDELEKEIEQDEDEGDLGDAR